MTSSVIFLSALAAGLAYILYLLYYWFIQPVQLIKLDDSDVVLETLKWLPERELADINSRGTMTRYRWGKMKRQLMREIDKSLGTKKGRGAATGL